MKWMFDLIRGSSLLACGGGLSYPQQRKQLLDIAENPNVSSVELMPVNAMGSDDWVATCGEVGPTHLPPIAKEKTPIMIQKLEKLTKKSIRAFLAYEMGQESVIIDAAVHAKLPIVDADVAGGRAVPSLDLVAPVLHGSSYCFSPLVAVNAKGELKILASKVSPKKEEMWLRRFSMESGGIIFFVGGVVNGAFLKKHLTPGTLTQAIALGKKITTGVLGDWDTGSYLIASLHKQTRRGFLVMHVELIFGRKQLHVLIQNENLLVSDAVSQHVIAQAPEIIVFVDSKGKRGFNSGELKKGMLVDLYVGKSNGMLGDRIGLKAWNNYIKSLKEAL